MRPRPGVKAERGSESPKDIPAIGERRRRTPPQRLRPRGVVPRLASQRSEVRTAEVLDVLASEPIDGA